MANPIPVPPISAKAKTVMRNPRYAQQIVDRLNNLSSAQVRVGQGPSSISIAKDNATLHISIEEIITQLQAKGHLLT